MRNRLLASVSILLILMVACNSNSSKNTVVTASNKDGEALFNSNCASCHNSNSVVAPPTFGIQKHYKETHSTKEAFTSAMVSFVQNPSEDKVLLKHAYEKFGLMPALAFSTEDLTAIAHYIYDGEFNHPKKSRTRGKQLSEADSTLLKKGISIASSTKKLLGSNLMNHLNSEGTLGALEFCNLNAIPLTSQKIEEFETFIQRVSNKPRNKNNAASDAETKLILSYQNTLDNGEKLTPQLVKQDNQTFFYSAITTNAMCLQCHGEPTKEVLTEITKRYPNDQATGYSENQVRGLWKIEVN